MAACPRAVHRRSGPARPALAAALAIGAFAALAAAAAPPRTPAAAAPAEPEPLPGLESVLADLRRGGFVLYFRHALTEPEAAGAAAEDVESCATQRNLTAEGREQAQRIGAAIRALGIPVGTVVASPFCRCQDTAQLAFGRYEVSRDLYFAIDVDAAERARLSAALRRMLGAAPAAGSNAVIVAHTANLKEAADLWPKPEGVAFVFRPLGGDRFAAVARVEPEQWTRAAAAAAPKER